MTYTSENPTKQAFVRGLLERCPHCGKGKLFRAYLKQVDCCADCGERFADIRADDGPAWLTVMVVGHIVVALMLSLEATRTLPLWLSISLFTTLSGALVLALLQRAKGAFIGAIWAMKAPGSEAAALID